MSEFGLWNGGQTLRLELSTGGGAGPLKPQPRRLWVTRCSGYVGCFWSLMLGGNDTRR